MGKIELIFFKECPNYLPLKSLLEDLNLKYAEVDQDLLNQGSPYKNYCSPTLIIDEKIIVGARSESASCSLINSSMDEIRKKIMEEI